MSTRAATWVNNPTTRRIAKIISIHPHKRSFVVSPTINAKRMPCCSVTSPITTRKINGAKNPSTRRSGNTDNMLVF